MPNLTETKTELAIEIDSLETWKVLTAIDATLKENRFEDIHGCFLVLNAYDEGRWAIITPDFIGRVYDHIEPSPFQLKFRTLHSK